MKLLKNARDWIIWNEQEPLGYPKKNEITDEVIDLVGFY